MRDLYVYFVWVRERDLVVWSVCYRVWVVIGYLELDVAFRDWWLLIECMVVFWVCLMGCWVEVLVVVIELFDGWMLFYELLIYTCLWVLLVCLFMFRAVGALTGWVEVLVIGLFDWMEARVDLVELFVYFLLVVVIVELFGVLLD